MSALYRHVFFPAWHFLKRDGVNKAATALDTNQWQPATYLRQLQRDKLLRLLCYARDNVPYFGSNVLAAIESLSTDSDIDLTSIPIMTKSIIRNHQRELVSVVAKAGQLIENSTSGSTGESLRFFTDRRALPYRKAAGLRSNQWTGWRLGERSVRLWGAQIDQARAAGLRGKLHGLVSNDRFFNSFELTGERMAEYANEIRKFRPVLLTAYASSLEVFAQYCSEEGIRFPTLKGIISSAETLWPHQRELAEATFGVRVFDRYGSREFGQIASQCEVGKQLHLSIDRVFVEIVRDDGSPCAPGEAGRLLITDLDNYGMPLIRYDIVDRGSMSTVDNCPCGRGLPLMERIDGRTLDVVETEDGRKIGGTFWSLLLKSRPGIRQFQLVQRDRSGAEIRYVKDSVLPDSSLDFFKERISQTCGPQFDVTFREVDSIAPTKSGKVRMIVSMLTPENR